MNIKDLFDKGENGTLTFEQFDALAKENDLKFVNLSDGKYVSKSKYESDLKAKDSQIETKDAEIENLNNTITTRDSDLVDLKKQLEAVGNDASKLDELTNNLSAMQTKYENDIQDYQARMAKQAYEFAVKEFANAQKFSSQAAKRDFINSMIAKNLQMDGDKILGREDFLDAYNQENSDAFYVEEPKIEEPKVEEPKVEVPTFVMPTQQTEPQIEDGFKFNFMGVRAHD